MTRKSVSQPADEAVLNTPVKGPDDPRQYVRIAVDMPGNLKMNAMSDPLMAIAASVIAICTSASSFTDGHVPIGAMRLRGVSDTIIKEMIAEDVWHDENHQCERCEDKPKPGWFLIHDYLRHQRSAQMVRGLKAKRAIAGAASAEKRWGPHRARQEAARKKAEAEAVKAGEEKPVRDDVLKLCEYLAKGIQANDSKNRRPAIGQAWLDDMRRIIDIDKFTPAEVGQIIRWTQKHPFWSKNIKSPHKLRQQLRADKADLMARMEADPSASDADFATARPSRASQALSVAERLDREYGGQQPLELPE